MSLIGQGKGWENVISICHKMFQDVTMQVHYHHLYHGLLAALDKVGTSAGQCKQNSTSTNANPQTTSATSTNANLQTLSESMQTQMQTQTQTNQGQK